MSVFYFNHMQCLASLNLQSAKPGRKTADDILVPRSQNHLSGLAGVAWEQVPVCLSLIFTASLSSRRWEATR